MADTSLRIRDLIDRLLPPWLAQRVTSGKTAGYRFIWGMVAPLDAILDMLNQGLLARYPGVGTPTAIPLICRSRGLIPNQDDTPTTLAARLGMWLDTWSGAGSAELIASSIHGFLSSHPRVRVITRSGLWVTCDTDGTITKTTATWDWDSVSNPERNDPDAPWWSDMFVVVQPSQWALRPGDMAGLTGDDGFAFGHLASRGEVEAIIGLLNQWKGAHSCIRAVIWTTDPTRFDPTVPASCPNGTWGQWGMYSGGHYVASGRDLTTCRYWEPR